MAAEKAEMSTLAAAAWTSGVNFSLLMEAERAVVKLGTDILAVEFIRWVVWEVGVVVVGGMRRKRGRISSELGKTR